MELIGRLYIILYLYCTLAIAKINTENQTTDGCLVPAGEITLTDSKTKIQLVSGTFAPQLMSVTYSCPAKYTLDGNVKTNFCYNGWINPHPKCQKACPPIQEHTIIARCEYKGEIIDCSTSVPTGTTAKISCAVMYEKPKNQLIHENLICHHDGKWDYAPYKCNQICGTIDTNSLIRKNGTLMQTTKAPWHVGIYYKSKYGNYTQICGGTIIESKFVVSAAQCFWNDKKSVVRDLSKYVIYAGKFYRDYDANQEPLETQIIHVSKIDMPITFIKAKNHYLSNIVVITLKDHIKFNNHVRPICRNDQLIANDTIGEMFGWGLTHSETFNPELRSVVLSTIDQNTCRRKISSNQIYKFPHDQFCGDNSTEGCPNDTGGGLVIPRKINGVLIYYLKGVLSTFVLLPYSRFNSDIYDCATNLLFTFTNIKYYKEFIDDSIIKPTSLTDPKRDMMQTNETDEMPGCLVPTGNLILTDSKTNVQLEPGTVLHHLISVDYSCPEKHILEGPSNNFCNLEWNNTHPDCIKTCPPIQGHTIKTICSYRGKEVDCSKRSKVGTSAYISCATMYKKPKNHIVYEDIFCLQSGKWDNEPFECEQICGTVDSSLNINNQLSKTPWHVGIYSNINEINNGTYEQICGGTIVESKIVISSAFCVWNHNELIPLNVTNIMVAAGKFSRDYYNTDNDTLEIQIISVSKIDIPITFGVRDGPVSDIAVLTLQDHIKFGDFVRPACLNLEQENDEFISNNVSGVTAGWGGDKFRTFNDHLRFIESVAIDSSTCRVNLSVEVLNLLNDKFCLNSTEKNNVCNADIGSGFIVPENDHRNTRYYLRGVLNYVTILYPSSVERCYRMMQLCTNIKYYKPLIYNLIHKMKKSSGCLVPIGDVILTEKITQQKLEPGQLVSIGVSVEYSCPRKYALIGNANNVCEMNWKYEHPKCKKICPSIDNRTIEVRCYREEKQINCDHLIEPGTSAKIQCGTMYTKPRNRLVYEDIYCQTNGEWDHEPFKCEQLCGKINTNFAYSVGSKITEPSNVPWHAAIYMKLDSGRYEYICGGTIVQSKIVISAAHCFWNPSELMMYDETKFRVAVGKFYSDYYATETLEIQHMSVKKIDVPKTFFGVDYDFANDIAVVTLSNNIKYRSHISPACLLWKEQNDQYMRSNISGVVAGWGVTDTGTYSPELRSVELLSMDSHSCRKKISKGDRIAGDKFCVETSGGKNVCQGDSGGGFIVSEIIDDVTYFHLWGIVSNGIRPRGVNLRNCNENFTTTFTNVQFYKDFVNNAIINAY